MSRFKSFPFPISFVSTFQAKKAEHLPEPVATSHEFVLRNMQGRVPSWNEKFASTAEMNLRADREDPKSVKQMQQESIEGMLEKGCEMVRGDTTETLNTKKLPGAKIVVDRHSIEAIIIENGPIDFPAMKRGMGE